MTDIQAQGTTKRLRPQLFLMTTSKMKEYNTKK